MPRMAARGSVPRRKPKALSTDAALAGGPARSSREPAAFWGGGGAKGPAHQGCSVRSTGAPAPGGIEGTCQAQGQAVCDSQADGEGGGDVSPPPARQPLPEALGWEEVQAAADLQAVQAVVGRAPQARTRPVRPLAMGSCVLIGW